MKSLTIEVDEHMENTFMPYAMMTILDRALPDVRDGMKPVHRRTLYTMHKKGCTHNKDMIKSATVVADTMNIHFHGDTSIYDALALMTDRNETLLYPYINADGGFGKVYNTDKPAAYRYTYCRLNKFSEELFKGLDKNIVGCVEEGGFKQPVVLPVSYPNILIKPNNGISVGEACNFPSFNMNDVIDCTVNYVNNKAFNHIAPDFSTGGELIYNQSEIFKLCEKGRASIQLRSKYRFNEKDSCIEVYEIPYNTTTTQIVGKITDILKGNRYKEILDIRDETGYDEELEADVLKIAIDIKKKSDPDIVMAWLFKNTPLQSTFSANMNCLVRNRPQVLGVRSIIKEWVDFRVSCVKGEISYDINQYKTELNRLQGLEIILSDLDRAISIIRNSKSESHAIDELASYFKLNKDQVSYIVGIKLISMNKEWIISKTQRIKQLKTRIEELSNTLLSKSEINNVIITQLQEIKEKYGQPRRTEIICPTEAKEVSDDLLIEDYNCQIVITKQGYLKKNLRFSDTQRTKENDIVAQQIQSTNKSKLLLFTDRANCYYLNVHELDTTLPSNLGDYLPTLLQLQDEQILYVISTEDFKGNVLFAFENGKVAKVNLSSYETKTNRTRVVNAYNTNSKLISIHCIENDCDFMAISSIDKVLIFDTNLINAKDSKASQGVNVLRSKDDSKMVLFKPCEIEDDDVKSYYKVNIPAVGKYSRKDF